MCTVHISRMTLPNLVMSRMADLAQPDAGPARSICGVSLHHIQRLSSLTITSPHMLNSQDLLLLAICSSLMALDVVLGFWSGKER